MTTLSDSTQGPRTDLATLTAVPWRPLLGGAIVLLVAALGIAGPRLISRSFLASFVENRLCAELGARCRVSGPIRAQLFPYPAIEAKEVSLSLADGQAAVRATHALAELRALPLIVGHVSVNHLDLDGAEIDIWAPAQGMQLLASANGAGAALMEAIAAAERSGNRLTRLGLDRSRLVIRSKGANLAFAVESLSGLVALPQGRGDLVAHLKGLIAGEVAQLHVVGPSLPDITRSEGSSSTVDAVLGENWLNYRGRLVKAPDLVAAGTLEASLPSLRHVLGPLRNVGWPSWLPDTDFHLAGHVFLTGRGVDFENTEFAIGRSHFAGGMSLRMTADGRPSLSGTIAAPLIELPDLSSVRPQQIALPRFGRLPDIDLRMSVRRVRIGGTRLDGIAAGLILADRRLDVTASQGLEGESGAKLRIVATPDVGGLAVKAQASSESVDVGSVLSSLSPHPALTGVGSFNLSLEGRGGNLDALERVLSGKASLQMKKGVVSLPSVGAEPVASIVTGVPSIGAAPAPGPRRFAEASFSGTVEHGVLTVTEGWIGEGTSQIAVDGKIDVADRNIDLSLSGSGEAHTDAPWHLRATGPWSGPSLWRPASAAK
jgi:AsmA protein